MDIETNYGNIRRILHERFGIECPDALPPLAKKNAARYFQLKQINNWSEFEAASLNKETFFFVELAEIFLNSHSFFYREPVHFNILQEKIFGTWRDEYRKNGELDLRVWSAASSFGAEAYSILFSMLEYFGEDYWNYDAGVLATDISISALQKGSRGEFTHRELNRLDWHLNLTAANAEKYFRQTGADKYTIHEKLRSEILFRWLNLNDEFRFKEKFDLIFFRNALIYFDGEHQRKLLGKITDNLKIGGVLILGLTDGKRHIDPRLELIDKSTYLRTE